MALVGCGTIARGVIALLKSVDVRCTVCDPFLDESEAAALGVKLCTLEEAFSQGDVVSLHTADKPGTRGMIREAHFSAMKEGATFINTARSRIVRYNEMTEVLQRRTDLVAILDVLDHEPPSEQLPLLKMANVIVSPHIAGSLGPECRRLGRYMIEEFRRYLANEPLKWKITKEASEKLA